MKRLLLTTCSALALSTVPVSADPINLAVAAASTAGSVISAGGVAAATFTGFGLSLSGISAVGAQFAVRAALGYALNALSSSTTRGNAANRGYQNVNQLGTALPHQVIYGETRIGGVVFYQAITSSPDSNQDRLHRAIAFAGHEIESYEAIYFNDEKVEIGMDGNVTSPFKFSGKARVKQHLGADDQVADSDLVAEVTEWTTAHRARGIAYLYVRFQDSAAFPNGVPVVTAKIRGKKLEDPREDQVTTVWSDNPALCIRDYLLSGYGLNESTSDIDGDLFEEAANACDEDIAGAKKYTCNGSFTLDGDPEDIIRNLLSSMGEPSGILPGSGLFFQRNIASQH